MLSRDGVPHKVVCDLLTYCLILATSLNIAKIHVITNAYLLCKFVQHASRIKGLRAVPCGNNIAEQTWENSRHFTVRYRQDVQLHKLKWRMLHIYVYRLA